MNAIVLQEAGGVDRLIYQDIKKQTVKVGEILVKVKAIGINARQLKLKVTLQSLR